MVILNCKICHKEFRDIPSRAKIRKTCSRSCQATFTHTGCKRKSQTISRLRRANAWNYVDEIVKKYSDGHAILWLAREYKSDKKIIRDVLKENNVSLRGRKGIRSWNKNKYNKHWNGKNNPNWKGGIAKLEDQIRGHLKNKIWKRQIRERDKNTCVLCGNSQDRTEVDHFPMSYKEIIKKYSIKNLKQALECKVLWDINNGRVLCTSCHYKTKKSNNNVK